MARQPYAHLAGDLSGWPFGMVPTPPILRNLDQYSSELVNGEDGGTYSPTDPITIGNSQLGEEVEVSFTSANCQLVGDIETVRGNASRNDLLHEPHIEPGLILEAGAVPIFENARTRDVIVPLGFFNEHRAGALGGTLIHTIDPATFGARSNDLTGSHDAVTIPLPFRAAHRGATITSVDFHFAIPLERTVMPTTKPKFRVLRCTAGPQALHAVGVGGYDGDGWLPDPASTIADYHNAGKTRVVTYVCDTGNTNLNPTDYFYAVQFFDETGGGFVDGVHVGNQFLTAVVHLTSIADFRQE